MGADKEQHGQSGKGGGFTPAVCRKCGYRRKRTESEGGPAAGVLEDHCFFYNAPCRLVYGYCRRGYGGRESGMGVGPVKRVGPVVGRLG